jgi:outer membrane protein insertion porin family
MIKLNLLLLLFIVSLVNLVWAESNSEPNNIQNQLFYAQSNIIRKINITGLKRINDATVKNYLPYQVGAQFDSSVSDEMIHALYETGFFDNIKLQFSNSILTIDIKEKPVIDNIKLVGEKEFDDEKLLKSLKMNGLASGQIFDKAILDNAVKALRGEYMNRGFYAIKIEGVVTALPRNRVQIVINFEEGKIAKIDQINFIGNQHFSNRNLQSFMFLNTGNLLSFWYKDNQYANDKLNGDLEKIRSHYLNNGFLDFKISSVQVQLNLDKTSVIITVNIVEGHQYFFDKIEIAGNTQEIPKNDLQNLISIEPGELFNESKLNNDIEQIKTELGNHGYAFASVQVKQEIVAHNHVKIILFIDPGKKVYVNQINITGNDKTRDTVIRREIKQKELAIYNATNIRESKQKLDQTAYFKNTSIVTKPVPNSTDKIDLDVKVEESTGGTVSAGVGFQQGQQIILNGSVAQRNIFGSGKDVNLSTQVSSVSQDVSASYVDPYFLANGTSLGYDIYYDRQSPNTVGISPYTSQTVGLRVTTGIPVAEYDKINTGLTLQSNLVAFKGNVIPLRFTEFTDIYGEQINQLIYSIGWRNNNLDNPNWPRNGALFSDNLDVSIPIIGANYYKFLSNNTWFYSFPGAFSALTWKINGQIGFLNPYGSSPLVPFYQNFFEGGINSLRGYFLGSLGPKDIDNQSAGGTRWIGVTNDLMVPFPFVTEKTVRLNAFFDMGTLWGGSINYNLSPAQEFRASYGVGLVWLSPLGSIRLSYAMPLFAESTDRQERFQFALGSAW